MSLQLRSLQVNCGMRKTQKNKYTVLLLLPNEAHQLRDCRQIENKIVLQRPLLKTKSSQILTV